MQKSFSDKMRWLSVLGAVSMLLTHAGTLQAYPDASGLPALIIKFCVNLAVPAVSWFFFSAAYWFFRGLQWSNMAARLKRRFFSLVVPFFAWNSLVLIAESTRGSLHGEGFPTGAEVLRAFYPLGPANGALWFVARLVGYILLAPLFFWLIQNQYIGAGLCVVVTGIALFCNVGYYSALYWLPVFLAGAWVGMHREKEFEAMLAAPNGRNQEWPLPLLLYLILMAAVLPLCLADGRGIYLVRLVSIPAVVVLAHFVKVPPADGWLLRNFSFYMFCFHWYPAVLLTGKINTWISDSLAGAALIAYLFICIVVFAATTISLVLLHRIAPRACEVLTGGR